MKKQDDLRFLELLDRWSQGDFTRADERELRDLTATDEFRREAWEGLTALPEADHAARLTALRSRLRATRPAGRVVSFPQWLAAAAAVVLLISVVWFFPKWDQAEKGPVARTQTEQPLPNPEMPTAILEPAKDLGNAAPAVPPAASRAPEQYRSTSGSAAHEELQAVEDEKNLSLAESEQKTDDFRESAAPADKTLAKPQADQPFVSAPPAPATTAPAGAAAGRQEAAKKAKSQPAPARSATDSTQWFKTDNRPDVAQMRRDAAVREKPEPANGWDVFTEYLRQSARLTPEALNNNISGTVRLQFNINENGEPQNFRILKSLGYGCDQEAIRLVQNWEWLPGKEPVIIEVKFVR